jgi:hypothetical protein
LSELARTILSNSQFSDERSSSGESQVLQHYLGQMFVAAGDVFAGEADLRCEINEGSSSCCPASLPIRKAAYPPSSRTR